VVTDEQAACPIGETGPLAELEETFSSVVEEIQDVTEDDVADEFLASPSLKRATDLPGDEDQVEPESFAPPSTAADEPEPFENHPTEDTITGGRPDEDLPDESLPEQPNETAPEVKHDSRAEPSNVDSISVSEAIAEENGESPLAEAPGLAFDGDADMKDLDAPTAPEGEEGSLPKAESPAEGTLDRHLVVDGVVSARATSPPESVLEEDKSHDHLVHDSSQALSESEASPEPPIPLASTTIVQAEITQSTGTPFAAFEEYSAVLSAPDIDSPVPAALPSQVSAGAATFPAVLYAPLPETANEFSAADDQDFSADEDEVLRSEAQQPTQTEAPTEDVGNPKESDVPDANYLPSSQSIDEVTMEVDSGSPRAVQPLPDSSSTTADDPSHSVINGTSEPTPIAQPGPSAEAVELPAEREPSAPREVAPPPQDMPVQHTSMSDEK
jgi:hypothetical protein